MAYQVTILQPDRSFVEAFFISDSLFRELFRISQIFELEHFNLAFLHEIKARALSMCSQKIKTSEPIAVSALATASLNWFDELLALITAIEKLHNPHSLFIYLG